MLKENPIIENIRLWWNKKTISVIEFIKKILLKI